CLERFRQPQELPPARQTYLRRGGSLPEHLRFLGPLRLRPAESSQLPVQGPPAGRAQALSLLRGAFAPFASIRGAAGISSRRFSSFHPLIGKVRAPGARPQEASMYANARRTSTAVGLVVLLSAALAAPSPSRAAGPPLGAETPEKLVERMRQSAEKKDFRELA